MVIVTDDELAILIAERNIQAMNDFCDVMEGKKKIVLPEIAFKEREYNKKEDELTIRRDCYVYSNKYR